MSDVLDKAEARGRTIGKEAALLEAVQSLMETMRWTAEQAMDKLQLAEAERKNLLKKNEYKIDSNIVPQRYFWQLQSIS